MKNKTKTYIIMPCPHCKKANIKALNINDCYWEQPYCPKCGKINITISQQSLTYHYSRHTEMQKIQYELQYEDGTKITILKEVE